MLSEGLSPDAVASYNHFTEFYAKQTLRLNWAGHEMQFGYYDCFSSGEGSRSREDAETLLFLPGLVATPDVFFLQAHANVTKGRRVILLGYPPVSDAKTLARALDAVFAALRLHQSVHVVASDIGAFIAQMFSSLYPKRVKSLFLSNAYSSPFLGVSMTTSMSSMLPLFLLQREVLSLLTPPSSDFVVVRIEALPGPILASRLALLHQNLSIYELFRDKLYDSTKVTVLETNDCEYIPLRARSEVAKLYPMSRNPTLKFGGDFPYVTNADEFNLMLEVHIRRNSSYQGEGEGEKEKEKEKEKK